MKIDISSGAVLFPEGTITAGQNRQEFLKSPLGEISKQDVMGAEWTHQDFEPEPGIRCSASFDGDRLDHMFIQMAIPTDASKQWTETLELERKSLHDAWLLAELGLPPYEFPWGKIVSDYDDRGCVSEIIIRYGNGAN